MLLSHKTLFSNSSWMTFGLAIRTVFQAAYFIIVARAMMTEQYGLFVSTTALVGILAPYASWGSGNVLVKYVSRNSKLFGEYWGAALATTMVSSFILTLIAIFVARVFLPQSFDIWLILSICLSELLFARIISICGQAFQSRQRLSVTAQVFVILSAFRLISAVLFVSSPILFTARNWSFFFLLSSILSVIPALLWVYRSIGWGRLSLAPMRSEFKEGFYFSLSLSSQGVYNDIDKTLLAKLISLDVAGFYAAAYRIVDVAFVPISALLHSTYAQFFQHGEFGVTGTKKFALKLLPWALICSLLAGSVTILLAPIMPVVLGQTYSASSSVIFWLVPLLPLKAIHYLAADSLTGAGFQGIRSKSQLLISGVNFIFNIWAIPLWGWKGAVFASWASDGLLAFLLWAIVLRKSREVS
jgi:O-antigen/teichoic acid export membrane protein